MGTTKEYNVVIAGGGPTGMTLAAELALAGVDACVVEPRPDHEIEGSRAGGLHARTLEMLDQRGIADRFVAQGQTHGAVHFQVPLDISDFPTRYNYVLALWQSQIERLLGECVAELRVPIRREREVTGFTQHDGDVAVALSDGTTLRARYLVGCDGGRSRIRKSAGIEFAGWDATTSWLMAEAETAADPEWGFRHDALGSHAIGRLEDGRARIVLTEAQTTAAGEPTLHDVRAALNTVYGTDFGIHSPTWITRFTDVTRQAAAYRDRRVLLAGDAAHVHAPLGGQGLNVGMQDAMNLGWKLAQVAKQSSHERLLDSYHAERHPVAARVARNTMAQVALRRPDERTKALGEYVGAMLGMDEPRRRLAAEISGLDIRYDLGDGHPLLGRRLPDLELRIASGTQRAFTLLHAARPVLLNFGAPNTLDIDAWADRVQLVDAEYDGAWEIPVLGTVTAPPAVLVRPDGYVAWVGDGTATGLADALATWFGPPRLHSSR